MALLRTRFARFASSAVILADLIFSSRDIESRRGSLKLAETKSKIALPAHALSMVYASHFRRWTSLKNQTSLKVARTVVDACSTG